MIGYKELEANELFDMMTQHKLVLVDVRNDSEVAKGVIPGSIHIALAMLPVQFESLSGDQDLVFYCHSGLRSAQAAAFVASKGRDKVFNLRGGVLAWGKAGYPFGAKEQRPEIG